MTDEKLAVANAKKDQRGVALVMVLGALSILTVLLTEFQEDASAESAAALADRDALKAEYVARSAINLSRLIIAAEPTMRAPVTPFLAKHAFDYPVLLDPEGSTGKAFRVDGIPKNFVYNREGKLVAQSIDMRTMSQFLAMLKAAGLE